MRFLCLGNAGAMRCRPKEENVSIAQIRIGSNRADEMIKEHTAVPHMVAS